MPSVGDWPLGETHPEITEVALDAVLPTPEDLLGRYVSRSAMAVGLGKTPTVAAELLDMLDQNLYGAYSKYSRIHLSLPRYEDEYSGMNVLDYLKIGMNDKAIELIVKDIMLGVCLESAESSN